MTPIDGMLGASLLLLAAAALSGWRQRAPAAPAVLVPALVASVVFWLAAGVGRLLATGAWSQVGRNATLARVLLLEAAVALAPALAAAAVSALAARAFVAGPHAERRALWGSSLASLLSSLLLLALCDGVSRSGAWLLAAAALAVCALLARWAPVRAASIPGAFALAVLVLAPEAALPAWAGPVRAGFALGLLAASAWHACLALRSRAWRSVALALPLLAGGSYLLVRPAPAPAAARGAQARTDRPNVVVVVIDTLRTDHTSVGGYARPTTPALERLSEQAVVFSRAYAPGSATVPSIKSVFTGARSSAWGPKALGLPPPATLTLAASFREAGYETAGFTANWLVAGAGFERGFATFESFFGLNYLVRSPTLRSLLCGAEPWCLYALGERARAQKPGGGDVVAAAAAFLRRRPAGAAPFFLYVHLLDPHWPYENHGYGLVPEGLRGVPPVSCTELLRSPERRRALRDGPPAQLQELVARYDEGVRRADEALAQLVEQLQRAGLDRQTLLVVLGDHGEELLERGELGHGHDVHPEQARVPLLLRFPSEGPVRVAPRRLEQPVSLAALFATLADYLGLRPPEPGGFESLRGLIEGAGVPSTAVVTEAATADAYLLAAWGPERYARVRLPYAQGRPTAEVFDEGGTRPRDDGAAAQEALDLATRIARSWPEPPAPAPSGPRDDAALERLKALGYVR